MRTIEWTPAYSGDTALMLVGEAPGETEMERGRPFVGSAGHTLRTLLEQSGVPISECALTNVFNFKLRGNDVKDVATNSLKEARAEAARFPEWEPWLTSAVDRGKYVPMAVAEESLCRLRREVEEAAPGCIVALGATAVWGLLGISPYGAVRRLRGSVHTCALHPGFPVVSTFHPSYIDRNWGESPFLWSDLSKAYRVARDGMSKRPAFRWLIVDSADKVETAKRWAHYTLTALPEQMLSVDIETSAGQIDTIGFARSKEEALCIPFYRFKERGSRYHTPEDELELLRVVADLLQGPNPKVFQNGSYDVWWLWEKWGMAVRNWRHDTRLMAHALWCELKKDLWTLTSLHTDFPQWKPLHGGAAKRDE